MTHPITPPRSRTTPARTWWRATLLTLVGLLAWDASGGDLAVMAWWGNTAGFPLRHHWWLETVLHDGTRRLAITAYLGVLLMVWRPLGAFRQFQRHERMEMAVGMTVSLLVISTLKRLSLTSCPWDVQAFGGLATYVSHWNWGVMDGGAGACFPGGHASAALAFLALALPGLAMAAPSPPHRLAVRLLVVVLAMGLVLGAVQTLRGAHYPSHTLWTGWICWVVAWLNHAAFTTWHGQRLEAR